MIRNPIVVYFKRVFIFYGKKNKIRGNHAHKKCSQFFIPVLGKFILKIKTPSTEKKMTMNHLSKIAVLVPPKYWCSIKFVSKNSILMVACDQHYNVNDYLKDFNVYKKWYRINHKK